MSVRNLTKRFIDIRNAAKANRSLLKGDNDSGDSDSGLLNVRRELTGDVTVCSGVQSDMLLLLCIDSQQSCLLESKEQ